MSFMYGGSVVIQWSLDCHSVVIQLSLDCYSIELSLEYHTLLTNLA